MLWLLWLARATFSSRPRRRDTTKTSRQQWMNLVPRKSPPFRPSSTLEPSKQVKNRLARTPLQWRAGDEARRPVPLGLPRLGIQIVWPTVVVVGLFPLERLEDASRRRWRRPPLLAWPPCRRSAPPPRGTQGIAVASVYRSLLRRAWSSTAAASTGRLFAPRLETPAPHSPAPWTAEPSANATSRSGKRSTYSPPA
eukprot:scaffold770_cov255-Pinguiococcus_pyrenoidosus.AAC.77